MTFYKYFKGTTAEQIRKEYVAWAKQLHPDNGGDAEQFKAMQSEFADMWARYKNVHENKSGEKYETNENSKNAEHKSASEYMDIIDAILNMGCDVEVCGSWLWIDSSKVKLTAEQVAKFHSMGAKWSKPHKRWYIGKTAKYRKHQHTSDATIRATFGSEVFVGNRQRNLALDEKKGGEQ